MTNLSDIKNEQALDVLANILEPAVDIIGDPKVKELYGSKSLVAVSTYIIKNYKKEIIQILASMEGVPADEYECSVLTLPVRVIQLLSDKELLAFFPLLVSQAQAFAGDAMENTTDNEK